MNIFTEMKLAEIVQKEIKLMHLKLTTSTALQVLAGGVQAANLLTPAFGAKGKTVMSIVIGIFQVAINAISHMSNPDGTDAKTAYIPKQG